MKFKETVAKRFNWKRWPEFMENQQENQPNWRCTKCEHAFSWLKNSEMFSRRNVHQKQLTYIHRTQVTSFKLENQEEEEDKKKQLNM